VSVVTSIKKHNKDNCSMWINELQITICADCFVKCSILRFYKLLELSYHLIHARSLA